MINAGPVAVGSRINATKASVGSIFSIESGTIDDSGPGADYFDLKLANQPE